MTKQVNKRVYQRAFSLVEISIVILIIGILFAGITKGVNLIKSAKINAARALTSNSIVNSIDGLVGWWETTAENSFLSSQTIDQTSISLWRDNNIQTISKKNISQATDNNKPLYIENAINGLPALKFDGSNDYLELSYNADLNPSTITIFAVVKILGTSAYGTVVSSRDDPPHKGYMVYITPSSTYQVWVGDGDSSWQPTGTGTVNITVPAILTVTHDGSTLTIYKNGTSTGSNSATITPTTSNAIRIGAGKNESSADYFLNGYLGELIIFDHSLGNTDRQAVESYLSQKWNIRI